MLTRDQHLEFCRRCKNRDFDPQHGIICKLTGKIADFDPTCPSYTVDESVKIEKPVDVNAPPELVAAADLPQEVREAFRKQQDMSYAIVGGLASSVLGAVIWALITYFTHYQIGYMAIAVGLLVGFGVRYFGSGIDFPFGVVGALFAVFGCLLGNLLSQIGFIAETESMGYFEVIPYLNMDLVISIYKDSFSPMDVVFYGIAGYEGYRFAFRPIEADQIKNGSVPVTPYAKYRFPAVATLFVLLSVGAYFISSGSTSVRTVKYESGAKHYEGTVVNGKEQGPWTFWWENGKVQQTGFFKDGKADSIWEYFNEEGMLTRRGSFLNNMQHGEWTEFHPNLEVASTGRFSYDRQHGPWIYYYDDGKVSQRGFYDLGLTDSLWEIFSREGKLGTRGMLKAGEQTGLWTYWNDEGEKRLEIEHVSPRHTRILNSWSLQGVQQVKNGNGTHVSTYTVGTVRETGKVLNGERVGIWKTFSESGQLLEEAVYEEGLYRLNNSWDLEGKEMVKNRAGQHKTFSGSAIMESGTIAEGWRTGEWVIFTPEGDTAQRVTYDRGRQNGPTRSFHPDGTVAVEGSLKDDVRDGEWRWYHPNGELECSVTYVDGKKEGEQPFFADDGTPGRIEVYQKGKMMEVRN